jgi:hypothetical protein
LVKNVYLANNTCGWERGKAKHPTALDFLKRIINEKKEENLPNINAKI